MKKTTIFAGIVSRSLTLGLCAGPVAGAVSSLALMFAILPDPRMLLWLIFVSLIPMFYGVVIGTAVGAVLGLMNGLLIGLVTCRFFVPLRDGKVYHRAVGALSTVASVLAFYACLRAYLTTPLLVLSSAAAVGGVAWWAGRRVCDRYEREAAADGTLGRAGRAGRDGQTTG